MVIKQMFVETDLYVMCTASITWCWYGCTFTRTELIYMLTEAFNIMLQASPCGAQSTRGTGTQ